jgi:predicted MFS family arabinose efflux permease
MSDLLSWHAVFVFSAALMCVIGVTLRALLPPKYPSITSVRYFSLLRSMLKLFFSTPILRRRAFYQAAQFGAFCLFWTASPLLLAREPFSYSQTLIAVFALVGVTGAIAAPFAGKAADRGWVRPATLLGLSGSCAAFLLTHFSIASPAFSLAGLVLAAILLDAGVTANLVLGQRTIFQLGAEMRSRLNALYIATIFVGGAAGSTLGAWAFARGGWGLTTWIGFAMLALAFVYSLTETRTEE